MRTRPTIERLQAGWGTKDAVVDHDLDLRDTLTLVSGPNGSGKTSIFKIVQTCCSQYAPVRRTEGRVVLDYSDGSGARLVYGIPTAEYAFSRGEALPRQLRFELSGPGNRLFGHEYTNPEKIASGRETSRSRTLPTRRTWEPRDRDAELDTLDAALAFGQFGGRHDSFMRLAGSRRDNRDRDEWLDFLNERQPIRLLSTERLGEPSIVHVCASELDILFAQAARNEYLGHALDGYPEGRAALDAQMPVVGPSLTKAQLFFELTNRYLESCGFSLRASTDPDAEDGSSDFPHLRLDSPRGGPRAVGALPSGARHVFVLFYAVLMHFPEGSLIFIDEPELSLHIGWQYALLGDLKLAAESVGSRLVVATHSPAIVNDWWDHVVELEQ